MTVPVTVDSNHNSLRLIVDVPAGQQSDVHRALNYLQGERIAVGDVMVQALLVAAEQAYFWTPAWQEKERAADADVEAGRYETFDSMEALLDFVDGQ